MLYFKNSELTATYHVALNTVLNWIKAAQAGRLELELVHKNGRSYIANTGRNIAELERLSDERRKYRNSRATREITPSEEFYRLFTPDQTLDLVSSLEFNHEVPRKYNYFNGGAIFWDAYTLELAKDSTANLVNGTIQLLHANLDYINTLLRVYKRVNVIDIGPGNAMTTKPLLDLLHHRGVLGKYIALDISETMLGIAEHNIQSWYGESVQFEGHQLDIEYDRFRHLLASEYLKDDANATVNLILFFGGTLSNVRSSDEVLAIIRNSMGRRDFLLHSQKLDSARARKLFDFNTASSTGLAPIHRVVFALMNVTPDLYEVEMGYDAEKKQRYTQVRIIIPFALRIRIGDGERIVRFEKGDRILVWRAWQRNYPDVVDLFRHNHFRLLHTSQLPGNDYLLTISQVGSDLPG